MEKFNRSSNNEEADGTSPSIVRYPKPIGKPAPAQEEDPAKKKKKNPHEVTF
jgi:hypothetical protein